MSLHYIIDGYNVLKQIPHLTDKRLSGGRQGLLDLIKRYRLCGKNEVTVVFDGKDDVVAPPHRSSYKIIFSRDESADEVIKRIVRKSEMAKRIIVVSNDRELVFQVKDSGAKAISVKDFTEKIAKKKSSKEDSKKIDLDSKDAAEITQELKDLWFKE